MPCGQATERAATASVSFACLPACQPLGQPWLPFLIKHPERVLSGFPWLLTILGFHAVQCLSSSGAHSHRRNQCFLFRKKKWKKEKRRSLSKCFPDGSSLLWQGASSLLNCNYIFWWEPESLYLCRYLRRNILSDINMFNRRPFFIHGFKFFGQSALLLWGCQDSPQCLHQQKQLRTNPGK